ncbi:MmpS family transport accessory protein, partial [Mycobacterium sp.]|uniref:MmpS family transport accessory protein n=1 Tax=Mycobacterium sp. TaxID=1785 RepID=UPI00127A727B
LPPETVTTETPPPRAPTNTAVPTELPTATPPPAASAMPPPQLNPRAFVYQVTGTKQIFDLVSVVYTDEQGMPHTDLNVSLPWSKTVVLSPGVQLTSVIATSLMGRLNCAITDAEGHVVVASATNSMIATCTH